ncbi:MAG TPA: SH3 domain-containing protein [Chthoniobacterales bacterium]|jgi:SH3-like domain-containing protein|nr:SH3 domain-containing protein [Chthoniobacterales bacterium]
MKIEVIKAYTAQYPDPISFEAGAVLQVERGDAEFPGWFWCRAPSGKEGWVHRSYLANTGAATTTSLRPYSALELTVTVSDRGVLLQSLDGWVYVRLDSRREGWIPETHVRPLSHLS